MMTVRRRLLLTLLPALALLMCVGAVADYWIAAATTREAYDQALSSAAYAAASNLEVVDGRIRFAPPAQAAALLPVTGAGGAQPNLLAITGPAGEMIAGTPGVPAAAAGVGVRVAYADALFNGTALRVASLKLPTAAGMVTVTVAEPRARRYGPQRVMLFGKLLVDFGELDVTLLVVWIAVFYGLRPLSALRDQVESQPLRELRRFDETQVPGELRPVVVAFNRVLELLQDAASAQQRFVADAAHQMRTPVAGLLAQLELLIQEPAALPLASRLADLQRGMQQLAHSANQLLALARAEPTSTMQQQFQPVALKPLVEALVERHLDRADRAGIDIGSDAQEATVTGDAWLLEDLLGNLIDNALKYTPRGGQVTVRCGLDEGHAFLEVEDNGPGIPEAERQRVRERFYRRPGTAASGVGLGLAIVEEIAHAHQALFSIGGGAGGQGARMRVRFARGPGPPKL